MEKYKVPWNAPNWPSMAILYNDLLMMISIIHLYFRPIAEIIKDLVGQRRSGRTDRQTDGHMERRQYPSASMADGGKNKIPVSNHVHNVGDTSNKEQFNVVIVSGSLPILYSDFVFPILLG